MIICTTSALDIIIKKCPVLQENNLFQFALLLLRKNLKQEEKNQ